MSNLERLQDAFLKADALAQQGDQQAREDARAFAAEIRRLQQSGGTKSGPQIMPNVNRGIAESVGGMVDLLNPFDGDEFGFSTGSAVDGMTRGMEAMGVNVAQGEPQGAIEAAARGGGNAAGALVPVAKLLQAAKNAGGMFGALADDASAALNTWMGSGAEVAAGALSRGAEQAADDAGAPEWVGDTAAILAPMSVPAVATAAREGGRVVSSTPTARIARGLVRSVAPMSEAGASEMARTRLHELAGGEDRARELGAMISRDDVIGRTPAQQTNDPNLLGLEQAVADENPVIREELSAGRDASRASAQNQISDMGGDVADARRFFDQRLEQSTQSRAERINRVLENAKPQEPGQTETANSRQLTGRLKSELDGARSEESSLWAAVPKEVQVGTSRAREVAKQWEAELGRAGRGDMPNLARNLLLSESGYGDLESAQEVHRLYSKLRETARNARAGTQQRATLARVADDIAAAILEDMDAVEAVSKPLADARAYTKWMAETFDQGAVGRILRRTNAGDEQIAPDAALARTVGRGGAQGFSDDVDIRAASPQAGENVSDYLRGQFNERILKPNGDFDRNGALRWMRDNRELLSRYPELQKDMQQAIRSSESAEAFAARSEARAKAGSSALVEFGRGQDTQAAASVLGADDPARAAQSVMATARKDKTGKAVAGVKAAFTDFLVAKAGTAEGLSGGRLVALLKDRKANAALRRVFKPDEFKRLEEIASALASLDTAAMDVGGVINTPANRIIDTVVRIQAARLGGNQGGGSMGGSLQTANIAVENARRALQGMTNARARQILTDAVQDPELMRALLFQPKSATLPPQIRSKLAPYLVGAGAAQASEQ